MPPATNSPALNLLLLSSTFRLTQLAVGETIPADLLTELSTSSGFVSITRTSEEISILREDAGGTTSDSEVQWRCIKVVGPMDFGLTGILCDLTTPLKVAQLPIFAISTWNTDFLLVPVDKADEAVSALKRDGWTFAE